jgi:hypothetical protein
MRTIFSSDTCQYEHFNSEEQKFHFAQSSAQYCSHFLKQGFHAAAAGVKSAFSSAGITNSGISQIATSIARNLDGNLANAVPRTFGKR